MTFQRLMERCFQDMNLAELIIFLDDVLVHAKSLEELEERTINVLARLRKYGLKHVLCERSVSFRFSPYSRRDPTHQIRSK